MYIFLFFVGLFNIVLRSSKEKRKRILDFLNSMLYFFIL